MALEREEFFAIMSAFPTGVAIVTTLDADGQPRGLTTNAVCAVSADPPLLLGDALAIAECRTEQELEAGDHLILTGVVEAGRAPDPERVPILYYRRAYGSTPTAAS